MSVARPVCCLLLLVGGVVAGSAESNPVQQTSAVLVEAGQPAQMDCSQDLGGHYLEMSRYLQRPGEGLTLMVHTVPFSSQPDFGRLSRDKYSATKDEVRRGAFTVRDARPSDSGVYYCAVSTLTAVQAADRVNIKPCGRLTVDDEDGPRLIVLTPPLPPHGAPALHMYVNRLVHLPPSALHHDQQTLHTFSSSPVLLAGR